MAEERQSGALASLQYRVLVWAGTAALVLMVVNEALVRANDSLRTRAAARQQFINESLGLSRLNNELVQALAKLSIDRGDRELREALALYGISFKNTPASATGQVPDPSSAGTPAQGGNTSGR
jgi:hypothetical protein